MEGGRAASGWPRVSRSAGTTIVWLSGEQDATNTGPMNEVLTVEGDGGDADLIVDLSGVTFMDGSSAGALRECRLRLEAQGRSLSLRHPSACTSRLLCLCGLGDIVEAAPPAAPYDVSGPNILHLPMTDNPSGSKWSVGGDDHETASALVREALALMEAATEDRAQAARLLERAKVLTATSTPAVIGREPSDR